MRQVKRSRAYTIRFGKMVGIPIYMRQCTIAFDVDVCESGYTMSILFIRVIITVNL